MENAEFRKAMGEMRAIWVAGNEYMTRAAPWTHIKTDRAKAAVGVRMGLNLIHQFAHLLWPVMPDFAKTIHECIQPPGYRGGVIPFPEESMAVLLDDLSPGQPIKAPEALIAKISDEQIAEWKERFDQQQIEHDSKLDAHLAFYRDGLTKKADDLFTTGYTDSASRLREILAGIEDPQPFLKTLELQAAYSE